MLHFSISCNVIYLLSSFQASTVVSGRTFCVLDLVNASTLKYGQYWISKISLSLSLSLTSFLEFLGSPQRNVQLPFSVIYVAKGKSRPELSARYLIRHMFTEDVLVKSNVYGNLERGVSPLDCNKINALRGK